MPATWLHKAVAEHSRPPALDLRGWRRTRWNSQSQLVLWLILALAALALLAGVLVWEHRNTQARWGVFLAGDPRAGAHLFFDKKGCGGCHSVNGSGGKLAPDLGFQRSPQAGLEQIVTAMWNHAPRMWDQMRKQSVPYPALSQEEMAHLFAFLYTARYVDEPGDPSQGRRLLATKSCLRCHALNGDGGTVGPDLASVSGVDTPIRWTQAMWNHAPAMERSMHQLGLKWPKFEGREMNHLLAYVREVSQGPRREMELLPASPERGWNLFRGKSCVVCHAVGGHGGRSAPELGPSRELPLTIVQFAGVMWNHSPEMLRELRVRGIDRPVFNGQEIADLVAFLHSLRYFEPIGSPEMGQTLFVERGCGHCHGDRGEGNKRGPALRGRGLAFTSIALATALWSHGPKMYQRAQEVGRPWPNLAEKDVGDVVSFLNAPPRRSGR